MHVVVMGAGVVGVTTAWQLLEDGHEVTVIDRQGEAAGETSFANAGLVAVGHALAWANPRALRTLIRSLIKPDQPLRFRVRADPAFWRFSLAFLRQCTERARPRQHAGQAPPVPLRPAGAAPGGGRDRGRVRRHAGRHPVPAPHAGDPRARHRQSAASSPTPGSRWRWSTASARPRSTRRSAPTKDRIAGAIYCPTDESGDAGKFTRALAALCAGRGARFRYRTTIKGVDARAIGSSAW